MYYEIDMIFTLLKFIPFIYRTAKAILQNAKLNPLLSENNTKVKVELECVLFTCFLTADEDS